jgi:hypothetical protein|tara:strand:- start:1456 stop:1911 length:456 start_codon:yes stop_codon:yes gene_type:complete
MEKTMEKVNTMELTTYTYRSLADLLQAMFEVSELKGVKFSLQISKNISLIKEELSSLEESSKPTAKFLEIAQLVQQLETSESISDEEKKEKIQKIESENVELVEERKSQIAEFTEMLKEEIGLSLFKISEDSLPVDITAKQLLGINLIIKE